jgi:hypothetical protein
MWMACATQEEIAKAIGYSRQAIGEFVDLLQNAGKRTGSFSGISTENPPLIPEALPREFEGDGEGRPRTNGTKVVPFRTKERYVTGRQA